VAIVVVNIIIIANGVNFETKAGSIKCLFFIAYEMKTAYVRLQQIDWSL